MNEDTVLFLVAAVITIVVLWLVGAQRKSRIDELNNTLKHERERNRNENQSLTESYRADIQAHSEKVMAARTEIKSLSGELRRQRKYSDGLENLIHEKTRFFPWLATAYADYQELLGKRESEFLISKKHPARKAAESVKLATARAVDAERRFRSLKYRMELYEKYFPWITEITGDTIAEFMAAQIATEMPQPDDSNADPVRQHLSEAEYHSLTTAERNQLALERWRRNRKSNWEVGRMYERFVGYEYEAAGYRVEYFGAVQGFDDLGRDLIIQKDGETRIIQCKYWSQSKIIHEKHIFQLFGTVVEYIARQNIYNDTLPLFGTFERFSNIIPVFVTSTKLSDKARDFAEILRIEVRENVSLGEYPIIKCNISKRNGEKVYHLPFDQQYDRTRIEPEEGEFYAWTAKEAESSGFRRAFRWRPGSGD